jgi:RNA recognition motif-containing protein
MEEERRELTAVAKERKIKKEYEIFVGGLDRDATEEDLRKVFEKIGEVVEVRLHKNLSTNRNKGYAFVKFANKGHVKRALSEMKNPVVCITP